MGSSGGGSGNPALLAQAGVPMPGLPVAGKDSNIGDPYNYGKFQNFLPDIPAEGRAPSATGLRPDMFKYRSPDGILDQNSGDSSGSAKSGDDNSQLRDLLAKLSVTPTNTGDPQPGMMVNAPQTMGLGGGGGGGFGGGAFQGPPGPPGSNPVGQSNAPIDYGRPGWRPPDPSPGPQFATDWRAKDAAAAAAAAAAAKG